MEEGACGSCLLYTAAAIPRRHLPPDRSTSLQDYNLTYIRSHPSQPASVLAMDSTLKCNDLKCRIPCPEQAVVTTCSHIFCVNCAARLGLIEQHPNEGPRTCPACYTQLVNPDDAVVTALNPSEDYKTSILSGLSPAVIMECAGRGLAFWAYQMVQDITYQEYVRRSLTDKHSAAEAHAAEIERALREDNARLNNKMSAMRDDNERLHAQVEQLQQSAAQKSKDYSKMSALYNKIKQRERVVGLESAADHGAEEILMQAASQHQQQQNRGPATQHPVGQSRQRMGSGSNGSGGSGERRPRVKSWPEAAQPSYAHQSFVSGQRTGAGGGYRTGFTSSHGMPQPPGSSQHRTRLPQTYTQPTFGHFNETLLRGDGVRDDYATGNESRRLESAHRSQYTADPSHNPNGNYGLSAGMRVGRPPGGSVAPNRPSMISTRAMGNYASVPLR
ncbi:E3 ubiquitin-protein ligase CCNB1IP1 [Cercospora beticola]|uniref:E3 ubiquitin-protein ligase CCNB1IP1 n=1 Tax=Cercospora beticola TaxID=122368 RepID=A0A2G5H7B1_CERBT|nr:E3 ubiquitin-protein ligase CCNB1IP1 [Cercospora beticola]PIA88425.1 E3 ubiquitin-protein ligase CCNB1IP1 [Cercospora beticola]WPB03237.1 hypothetical protein RHO25_007874 [Cercospora beticola]